MDLRRKGELPPPEGESADKEINADAISFMLEEASKLIDNNNPDAYEKVVKLHKAIAEAKARGINLSAIENLADKAEKAKVVATFIKQINDLQKAKQAIERFREEAMAAGKTKLSLGSLETIDAIRAFKNFLDGLSDAQKEEYQDRIDEGEEIIARIQQIGREDVGKKNNAA